MEACEQVQKRPLKLKGVAELSMTEQRQGQTPGSDGNEHKGQGEEVWPGKVDLGPGGLGGDAANGEDPEESIQNPQTESRGLNRDLDTLMEHYECPESAGQTGFPAPGNILLHTPLCLLLRQCFSKQCALILHLIKCRGFPGGAVVENLPANAGDTGSSPGLGRSHMPRSNWAREPQLLSLRVWSLCSATREAATAFLVAQWLRIRLPMQGTQVRALVWEDPTCRGATKPVCHNY
ncbi:hypothetical protein J1605_001335 [Eschrichtius robustus]|uniref:Uncharacterized protein n=1 Tax=Eschrichtius robustus TaxID=9764 RepID=A0AB34G9X0_ESCRO|nr:hypothetical protein J1605_001335 [Eschrichtius robustus]